MKKLLQILLSECIKIDFKTMCSDGQMRYTGMCSIADDIQKAGIISKDEYWIIKKYLGANKPEDARSAHWYESTTEGNGKRIKFLEDHIDQERFKAINVNINAIEIFEIKNKQHWINSFPGALPKIPMTENFIWIDSNGNITRSGEDFIAAEKQESYPIKIYLLKRTSHDSNPDYFKKLINLFK